MTMAFDLRDQLFERRIVVASGWLDESQTTDVGAQLLALDALGDDEITLRLESLGCTVEAALALVDTIAMVGVEIHAVGSGRLRGGALGPLSVCDRRSVTPHLVVELREPEARFALGAGTTRPEDLLETARSAQARRRQLCALMARGDAERAARLESGFERGQLLDADDVVAAGLADEILRPTLGFGAARPRE
jgi:ATP-dependent Clp protease protease subunit